MSSEKMAQEEQELTCAACGGSGHSDCCGQGVEEGEICLYPNMPWIHDFLGSQLEHQLTTGVPSNRCRNYECQKPLQEGVKPEVSWCSPECRKKWEQTRDLRLAVGKHDLRIRGFD